ncbi:MAG: TIGR04086 family membrane protein [Actinomycetota bacterium]|nr:TIGR04086 family membrane protein [Actinomycetota bacterium]
MSRRSIVETGRDRRALAADAGFGSISLPSILAGVLVAYGAFAILAALAAAIVDAIGVDTDVISTDYEQLSIVGGLITAAVLFLSYLFGGYVAGRMARRSGLVQGLLVAVLGLIIVAAVAALVNQAGGTDDIVGNLRDLGVPTTADEYGQAFTVAGLAALAGIVLGGLLGGILGERWHGRLLARAVDPNVGTEAEMRTRAQQDMARAEEERTRSFERARQTSPERARRADRDALADDDRRLVDDDVTVAGPARDRTVVDRSSPTADDDRPSAWRSGAAADRPASDRPATGRPAGPDQPQAGGDYGYWQRRS